ncbi:MAG: phospholipase D-like domain-containing protein [Candidatus Kariarchaeaceae archaeon]
MVIQSTTVTNYYKSVFESDWSDGERPPVPSLKLSSISNTKNLVKTQSIYPSHTTIPKTNFTGIYNVTAYVNPDNADEEIFRYLENAKESIYVSMYTISRPDFNNTLIALKQANPSIDIQVLISNRRVGASENVDTHAAAQSLVDNQIQVYNSTKDDDKVDGFYHNKYWIIDGKHTFIYSGNWSPRSVTPQLNAGETYQSGYPNRDMGIAVHDATDIASFVKTEVWDNDVEVADTWELSTAINQISFEKGDIVTGNVNLKAQLGGLPAAEVSYKFGTNTFIPVTVVGDHFEVNFDSTTIPNGITTFEVKAVLGGITYTDNVDVNVVNFDPSENWRFLITEVLPDPSVVSDNEGEFIEITNSFPFDLLIGGWRIGIIAKNSGGFNTGYGKTADYQLGVTLSNAGDVISLKNHKDEVIDSIAYGDGTSTDGSESVHAPVSGQSIQRSPLHKDTNTASDFIFATPDPKGTVPNVELKLPNGESSTTGDSIAYSHFNLISSLGIVVIMNLKRKK